MMVSKNGCSKGYFKGFIWLFKVSIDLFKGFSMMVFQNGFSKGCFKSFLWFFKVF